MSLSWADNASNETGFYLEGPTKTKNLQFSGIGMVTANTTTYSGTEAAGT